MAMSENEEADDEEEPAELDPEAEPLLEGHTDALSEEEEGNETDIYKASDND